MIQRQQMDYKRMDKTAEKTKNKMEGRSLLHCLSTYCVLRGFSFLIAEKWLNLFCKL